MKPRHRALVRLLAGVIPLAVATVGARAAAADPSDEPQEAPPATGESSGPPAAAESSGPATAAKPTHPYRTGGIAMTAVGGAGVVTAGVLAVIYVAQVVAFDSATLRGCPESCSGVRPPDDTLAIAAVISEVLGGCLVAGGVVLITRRGPPAKLGVSWMPPIIAIDRDRVQLGLQVAW
jgi:hypothetical protein